MEISRKTDYAIRLVAALMLNDGKPLSVRKAAAMQEVPYSFARGIQHDLVKSGVITAVRGAHGGMMLAIDPEQFTLAELIETLQGPISLAVCLSEDGWCARDSSCVFHQVWANGSRIIRDYLSSISMKDIIEGKNPYLKEKHF
ncbi:MAG: Rrf2 family transcriptional regulator [Coriobacteriia bacterium]|nr:Rrf2 family transcriptional regulator [Coriobacteriia bacterium]